MSKWKRTVIAALSGVALASAVIAFVLMQGSVAEPKPAQPITVRPIPTAIVQPSGGDRTRMFPGKVRASRRVELAFSVPGLLEHLNAKEGSSVRRGETLARLDQRDYRYALDMAKARLDNAGRRLVRFSSLREQKVATEAQFEDTETAHSIALAKLRLRQKAWEDTVLRAPFDGLVIRRHVENHEHVQAKQVIVSFQDISRIEVIIQIPERLIAQGGTGVLGALKVRFDADSDRWFDAVVSEHSAESDDVTQTYDVVVTLAPPEDLSVFPGMTATVKAKIRTPTTATSLYEGSALVPAEAVCRCDDGTSYVWVIDPVGGEPTRRSVETTELRGSAVEIRSGLRPGEHVAVAALRALRKGALVRPMATGKEGLDG